MATKTVLAAAVATLIATSAAAQSSNKVAFLIPTLYGPTGLVVDSEARLPSGETHSAHFNSAFQTEFTQFNVALASQLAAVPLPSSASGFTYELDPTLGVFQRSIEQIASNLLHSQVGPCGLVPWDQGSMWPGGAERPWLQKIVDALETKFFFAPDKWSRSIALASCRRSRRGLPPRSPGRESPQDRRGIPIRRGRAQSHPISYRFR